MHIFLYHVRMISAKKYHYNFDSAILLHYYYVRTQFYTGNVPSLMLNKRNFIIFQLYLTLDCLNSLLSDV